MVSEGLQRVLEFKGWQLGSASTTHKLMKDCTPVHDEIYLSSSSYVFWEHMKQFMAPKCSYHYHCMPLYGNKRVAYSDFHGKKVGYGTEIMFNGLHLYL